RDLVVVDDTQRADAGAGEVQQYGRAEAARADHEHARRLDALLALPADFLQHELALVAFDLFTREGCGLFLLHGRRLSRRPEKRPAHTVHTGTAGHSPRSARPHAPIE